MWFQFWSMYITTHLRNNFVWEDVISIKECNKDPWEWKTEFYFWTSQKNNFENLIECTSVPSERFLWYKFFENLIEGRRLVFWVKDLYTFIGFSACGNQFLQAQAFPKPCCLSVGGVTVFHLFDYLSIGLSRLLPYSFPFLLVKMKWKALLGNNALYWIKSNLQLNTREN